MKTARTPPRTRTTRAKASQPTSTNHVTVKVTDNSTIQPTTRLPPKSPLNLNTKTALLLPGPSLLPPQLPEHLLPPSFPTSPLKMASKSSDPAVPQLRIIRRFRFIFNFGRLRRLVYRLQHPLVLPSNGKQYSFWFLPPKNPLYCPVPNPQLGYPFRSRFKWQSRFNPLPRPLVTVQT